MPVPPQQPFFRLLEAFAELDRPTSGEIYAKAGSGGAVTTAEDSEALLRPREGKSKFNLLGPLGDETEMEIHR